MASPDQFGTDAAPEAPEPVVARKTLIFANDKSSGKTTTANAVLVSLLDRYPMLMRGVEVREYERQPRLATIFRKEDGLANVAHYDARNAQAFDAARHLAGDPQRHAVGRPAVRPRQRRHGGRSGRQYLHRNLPHPG